MPATPRTSLATPRSRTRSGSAGRMPTATAGRSCTSSRTGAISGASAIRPGYQRLLEAVLAGGIDVVLAEALDRLSRDQEDIAALHKRLRFLGVQLVTVGEGEIGDLHIGLKGAMNALYLKDLADKTRRGLEGRVRAGRSGGGTLLRLRCRRPARSAAAAPSTRRGRGRPPHLRGLRRRPVAEGHRPSAERRRRARTARHPLARHRDPRPPPARHRHPQQRALHRAADLEPAALRQGPGDRPAGLPAAIRRRPGSPRTFPSFASSTMRSGSA